MLVYSTGDQVDGFTYDPGVGEFFLSHPKIQHPRTRGGIYSINEGNYHNWAEGTQRWVDWIKSPGENKSPLSTALHWRDGRGPPPNACCAVASSCTRPTW